MSTGRISNKSGATFFSVTSSGQGRITALSVPIETTNPQVPLPGRAPISQLDVDDANRQRVRLAQASGRFDPRIPGMPGKPVPLQYVLCDIQDKPQYRGDASLPFVAGPRIRQSEGGNVADSNVFNGGAPGLRGGIGGATPSRLSPWNWAIARPRQKAPQRYL